MTNVNNIFDIPLTNPFFGRHSFCTLAPELMKFVGVTIDTNGKNLPGWVDYCVTGRILSWKRNLETDKRTLQQIVDDPSVKDNTFEECLQMIREGKL